MTILEINPHHIDGAGAKLHQIKHVSAIERQAIDLSRTHGGRKLGVLGIYSRRRTCYLDDFRSLTNF